MELSIELVNAVGGGDVNAELDLDYLFEVLETPTKSYDPEHHPSLYLRFYKEGATVLIFRTGKYNIAGADSIHDLARTNEELLHQMSNIGVDISSSRQKFDVRNLVYTSEFDTEFDLNTLAVGLGIEFAEYEPEQFPGVHYRARNNKGVFLIFRTGKVILTGVKSKSEAKRTFNDLYECLLEMSAI